MTPSTVRNAVHVVRPIIGFVVQVPACSIMRFLRTDNAVCAAVWSAFTEHAPRIKCASGAIPIRAELMAGHADTFAMSRAYVRRLPTMASMNESSRSSVWRFTSPSLSLQVNSSIYRNRCLGEA